MERTFENKVSWLLAGARGVKSCMCSIVCSFVRVLEKPLHIPVEINRGIRVAIEAVYELRLGVKRVHVETGAEWRFAPGIHARHPAPAPDESRDTTNQ